MLERLAELESENEDLRAQLDAAERGSADVSALEAKNEEMRRRLASARSEVEELRERRRAVERKQQQSTSIPAVALAFLLGLALGIFHAR